MSYYYIPRTYQYNIDNGRALAMKVLKDGYIEITTDSNRSDWAAVVTEGATGEALKRKEGKG